MSEAVPLHPPLFVDFASTFPLQPVVFVPDEVQASPLACLLNHQTWWFFSQNSHSATKEKLCRLDMSLPKVSFQFAGLIYPVRGFKLHRPILHN